MRPVMYFEPEHHSDFGGRDTGRVPLVHIPISVARFVGQILR